MEASLREIAEKMDNYLDELRMLSDTGKPFAIVEGKSDTITLQKFLNIPLQVAYGGKGGKECVKQSCEWLSEVRKVKNHFGIIDSDFEFIETILDSGFENGVVTFGKTVEDNANRSLFYTDSHDLDVDVFLNTAEDVVRDLFDNQNDKHEFRSYLRRLVSDKSSRKEYGDLVKKAIDKVIRTTVKIGILRLFLFQSGIKQNIVISDCCSSKLVLNLEKEFSLHATKKCNRDCLQKGYSKLDEDLASLTKMDFERHLINGHDLVDLLRFIISQAFPSGTKESLAVGLATILSKSFDSSDFKKLNLYERIKTWAHVRNVEILRY